MKRYEVHFLAEAVTDLDSLFCYIAEKSSEAVADRYLERIERFCHSLESLPQRGTEIPGRVAGLRRMRFERRVTIFFRVGEERVDVVDFIWRT